MTTPSVDIIVPVWNNPFETRACLAAVLTYSPEARLIIVDNGSSRETQLMLEEFSEPLGEYAIFITSERNIGLVPAINMGLASSDRDFAVVVRPHVMVGSGWLTELLNAAVIPQTGLISPFFRGSGTPAIFRQVSGCTMIETFSLSFAALLLRGEMHRMLGGFDEGLDGGEWCLRDYIRRAETKGYHSFMTVRPELICSQETVFGSQERRQELARLSHDSYLSRWGVAHHYCLYFGPASQAGDLSDTIEIIVAGARRGHRFTLLLHRRQFKEFRKRGWNGLHTGITICQLPLFGAGRSLARRIADLQSADPDMILVRGSEGVLFPGNDIAILFNEMAAYHGSSIFSELHFDHSREVVL
jgi:glycosyltransferase involved in cell wall biosynthesis